MKRIQHALLAPFALLFAAGPLWGQQDSWDKATTYWEHQKFSAAQHHYDAWLSEQTDAGNAQVALALYRSTSCAIQLQHQDAAERVRAFGKAYPEHPLVRQAHWDFANYLYRKRDWKDAAAAFDSLNTLRMTDAQKLEMQFKRGHARFEMEDYEDARLDLFAVMEGGEASGAFELPARYYFSHISYLKGQAQVALEGFESLQEDAKLKRVVPIYIAQLLHETEQYDRLIEYAPVVFSEDIDLSKVQRADISRLVGDALYRRQKF